LRKIVLSITLLFPLAHVITAQDLQSVWHEASTPPSDARYEIVQTGVVPKWTLKLDRITGNVERLLSEKSGSLAWEKMRVLPHPKAVNLVKPHFQILTVSQPNQSTLLLDTESGATWRMVRTGDSGIWQPVE